MSTSAISSAGSGSCTNCDSDPAKKIAQSAVQQAEREGVDPSQIAELIKGEANAAQGVGTQINATG